MSALMALFHTQPLLLLAVLLALGAALGHWRVAGVRIGPAAVLFAAIAVSALGTATGQTLEIPEVVGTFGLVLFTYTIGVISGPQFFASLRRGWRTMATVVAGFVGVAVLAVVVGRALGLTPAVIAGSYAGALTNTPALAAAVHRTGDPVGPTIGYSITYLGGVVGMLLATAWALRRSDAPASATPEIDHLTIRVDTADAPTVGELEDRFAGRVSVSRIRHGHFANPTVLPEVDERIGPRDLVSAVGHPEVLREVADELGHISSHNLVADRKELDFRRVTLSRKELAGRTIGDLGLEDRFGAFITRVRRGDLEMLAHDGFVLQMGDRVRIIAPASRIREVSDHLGDSDRGMSDINVGGLALGLSVGLALGLVHVPLPGGGLVMGAAAGTLIAGLVFGRLGRIGPVVTSMSHGSASSLSLLGMVTFLAYAGVRAGQRFASAVVSDQGWRIALLGLALTATAALLFLVVLRRVHRLDAPSTAGALAGAQTQPAILAFAQERTGFDTRVALAYALVYPAAMIAKIIAAQVLGGL